MKRALSLLLVLTMLLALAPFSHADGPGWDEKIVYGLSGQGQELTAYRFGSGTNVLVMGFAIHGFEDNFDRDGLALVYAAEKLMAHLGQSELVALHDWTVYVLPCMNPDGTYYGTTNEGPGRCTTTYIDESGTLVTGTGIDMNRSFPVNFRPYTTPRHFNSTQPLACLESRALAAFLRQIKGRGTNVLFDVHGWYQQIISTSQRILEVTKEQFPMNNVTQSDDGPGYLTSYAHSLGYETCLLELPEYIRSMTQFQSSTCVRRINACVDGILKSEAPVCTDLGHQYEVTQIPAACDREGCIRSVCAVCGNTLESLLPALGHSYGEAQRLQSRTATRPGILASTCQRCGDQEVTVEPSVFEDVEPDRFYSGALDEAYDAGWISGMTETTFAPEVTLSRAMLVTILHRFQGSPDSAADTPFTDLRSGAYYEKAVRWAYENGIVNGVTSAHFAPHAPVSRQQAVAIFHRYVKYLGLDNGRQTQMDFADQQEIDDYAKEAAFWAAANQIILGDNHNRFLPEAPTTRAQAVTIVHRVKDYIGENQAPEAPAPGA